MHAIRTLDGQLRGWATVRRKMAKDVGRDKDPCYPDKEDETTLPRRRFRLPKVHVCQGGRKRPTTPQRILGIVLRRGLRVRAYRRYISTPARVSAASLFKPRLMSWHGLLPIWRGCPTITCCFTGFVTKFTGFGPVWAPNSGHSRDRLTSARIYTEGVKDAHHPPGGGVTD